MSVVMDHAGARVASPHADRILVAQYDEEIRERIVAAFVEDGHDVIAMVNGEEIIECLGIISRHGFREPDLIAMDVRMPSCEGIEFLEDLRAAGWNTPVLLMSPFASLELQHRVNKVGSAVLIAGPFDAADLRASASRVREEPRRGTRYIRYSEMRELRPTRGKER